MTSTGANGAERVGAVPAGRALVVVSAPVRLVQLDRRQATFVTQLVACRQRCPAYRTARRDEPAAATRAYHGSAPAQRACFDVVV